MTQITPEWHAEYAAMVEKHIAELPWDPETPDEVKTLVAGNIRHFAWNAKVFLKDKLLEAITGIK